ncbi:MAG: hypothetical protein LBJ67_18055 [Planctomycetaceae bacterium]|nr:hypothetical protein [Planctomycetaceae bacterium]
MNHSKRNDIQQKLTQFAPKVRDSLGEEILRDVEEILRQPDEPANSRRKIRRQNARAYFNAQVHCTKKSRRCSTLWGSLCGTSVGIVLGVFLAAFGFRLLPTPTITITPNPETAVAENFQNKQPPDVETPQLSAPEYSLDLDQMIEDAAERWKKMPQNIAYDNQIHRHYVSPTSFQRDPSFLILYKEMFETRQ